MKQRFLLILLLSIFSFSSISIAVDKACQSNVQTTGKTGFKESVLHLNLIKPDTRSYPLAANSDSQVRIAGLNTENLFDTEPTSGKLDAEFLPAEGVYNGPLKEYQGMTYKAIKEKLCAAVPERYRESCLTRNWNAELYTGKLMQISKMYKKVYGGKKGIPEISVFSEVENPRAMLDLAAELGYAKNSEGRSEEDTSEAHYKKLQEQGWVDLENISATGGVLVTNSPDERGIDVAIAYKNIPGKVELLFAREYFMQMPKGFSPTRNILVATFLLGGTHKLTVIGAHWPSQGSPTFVRQMAAEKTRELYKEYSKDSKVMIIGDLNTLDAESPHPIDGSLIAGEDLKDLQEHETNQGKDFQSPGSYYYSPKTQWSRLDRIILDGRILRARSSLRVASEGMNIYHPDDLIYEKSVKFYRDVETAKRIERETGETIKYKNIPEDAEDPRVKQAFLDDPELDVLEVREFGPARFYASKKKGKGYEFSGLSDHFSISVKLEW